MKRRKGFSTLVMGGLLVLLLCLVGTVFGKGLNPPVVGPNEKLIGPVVHGVIIAGWKPDYEGSAIGTVEGFLQVEDKVYAAIIQGDVPLTLPGQGFLEMTAADVPNFTLPEQLVVDYNMGDPGLGNRAVVFEEKDVSDFAFAETIRIGPGLTYTHILHCTVKISFIVLK